MVTICKFLEGETILEIDGLQLEMNCDIGMYLIGL